MKKRTLALALSLALSISMMSPAASSDFMEDDAFLAEEIAVQAETTVPAPAAEETIDIPFEVETLQEDTIVPEASGDFVDEVEMKDLLEEQETIETEEPQEADITEDTAENETTADDDFASEEEILADLPALAGQAGWTSVSNAGTVNYLYTTGEADGFGNPVFYTDKDGIVTIDGAEYCFDENGVLKTGKVKVGSKYIYLMDAEHATLKAGITNEEPNPINSDLGQRQKSYWNWNGTAFEYYTAAGYLTTVKSLIDAKIQNGTYAGYFKINDNYYVLNENGVPYVGDYEIKEGDATRPGLYYLRKASETEDGIPGAMAVDTWVKLKLAKGTRWRFYDTSGRTTLGIKATKLDKNIHPNVKDNEFLLDAEGYLYTEPTKQTAIDGYTYFTYASSRVIKSDLVTYKGARYYVDGKGHRSNFTNKWVWLPCEDYRPYYFGSEKGRVEEKIGWFQIDNGTTVNWYCLNTKGNAYVNLWRNDYYFDNRGRMASGKKTIDGKTYIFRPSEGTKHNGKVYKNTLVTYSGKKYYAKADGVLAKDEWITIGSDSYYFQSNCTAATGLKTIGTKTYLFRGSDAGSSEGKVYKSKLITYKGNKYYAQADGALAKSKWITIDGGSYYFNKDCVLVTNSFVKKEDGYGYVDANGKFITGWMVRNASQNKISYINTKAPGFVTNDYRIINGVRYYFDADGYRVSDLTSFNLQGKSDTVLDRIHSGYYKPYYLECDKANGTITVYTDSTKTLPIRTVRTSVGDPTSRTVNGTFRLTRSQRWQPLMGPSWGQYGTHVTQGIFVHSIACGQMNDHNLAKGAYDALGTPKSHGCMRVCVADAKWIYDHCNGATIKVFYGVAQSLEVNKGPLGRKPLVPRFGAGNFDPTDPAYVGNKYY